ncbi:hypothetical protein Tco_0674353 [Tanacetum coccineum]
MQHHNQYPYIPNLLMSSEALTNIEPALTNIEPAPTSPISASAHNLAKATWNDLVHSFEGPFDTKENRIMDLKIYLHEKCLSLSHGLRNANHTQTIDLADIYGRFSYEDNLILRRYPKTKKTLLITPSDTPISIAFFSNNIIQDFQENSDNEADERTSEEYLRYLELEFYERALLDEEEVSDDEEIHKRSSNYWAESSAYTATISLIEETHSRTEGEKDDMITEATVSKTTDLQ